MIIIYEFTGMMIVDRNRKPRIILHSLLEASVEGYIYLASFGDAIYKVGKTSDPGVRFPFFALKNKVLFEAHVWEVPDLDFCEEVALAMSCRYETTGEWREMDFVQVNEFIEAFGQFISSIDIKSYQGSSHTIGFVCWDESQQTTAIGELNSDITLLQLERVAQAILIDGRNFSRSGLSESSRKILSQGLYRKLKDDFARCEPGNQTVLTKVGRGFLQNLLD